MTHDLDMKAPQGKESYRHRDKCRADLQVQQAYSAWITAVQAYMSIYKYRAGLHVEQAYR